MPRAISLVGLSEQGSALSVLSALGVFTLELSLGIRLVVKDLNNKGVAMLDKDV